MDNYERSQLADALQEQTCTMGETLIVEGEENGDKFYVLLEGECVATKKRVDAEGKETQEEVKRMGAGANGFQGWMQKILGTTGFSVPGSALIGDFFFREFWLVDTLSLIQDEDSVRGE